MISCIYPKTKSLLPIYPTTTFTLSKPTQLHPTMEQQQPPAEESPKAPTTTTMTGGKQYHDVQPDDTVQTICAKYSCNATKLRKANNFKGSELPARLVIPKSRGAGVPPPRSRRLTLEVDENTREQLELGAQQAGEPS